jgi:hypothetical protein
MPLLDPVTIAIFPLSSFATTIPLFLELNDVRQSSGNISGRVAANVSFRLVTTGLDPVVHSGSSKSHGLPDQVRQ